MTGQDIDYEALARQHGAISSMPAVAPGKNGEIDYEALAKQHGAVSSQPAPTPALNPYQQAAERIPGGTGTSISAGPPKPQAEGPSWLERFVHAIGIPTSQGETSTAVQNMLTPQPEPGAEGLLKTEESLPVVGSDFRARAALARQGRPTSMIPFLGPAIAQFTESTLGEHPDTATALGSGVNVAGQALGLKSLMTPKAPQVMVKPPDTVMPSHVEALTGLIEDRGGTVDPHETATAALPTLRETAVRMGVDPSKLAGREAGQTTLKVAEQAVRDTQNEFDDIRKPYNSVLVDQKPIAQAYRDAITPELLANEPKVARTLERTAQKFDQPAPLEQVNQFRVRMNNQLNAFEQRGTTAQIMSDIETKAQKAATNAARDIEYNTVGRLSGLDPKYIRSLKQREGSLIEAKSSLTKEYNRASGQQGEAVSEGVREKLTNTFPSKHGATKSVIKNLIGPKPIAVLNARLSKMFAGMGSAGELPSYEQVQPPAAPQLESGPSGPLPGGEDAIDEATRGGPGSPPPTAPDTSQSFSRGGKMGTPQGIADQVVAAKSGTTANATARVDAHKVAKASIGNEVQAPIKPMSSKEITANLKHPEDIKNTPEYWDEEAAKTRDFMQAQDELPNASVSRQKLRAIDITKARQARTQEVQAPVAPQPLTENARLPDYLRETIQQDAATAKRLGIDNDIEELSAQGLTAKQVTARLADKFQRTPIEDRAQIVRSVRAARGIPSQDNMTEFNTWRQARTQGLQSPMPPITAAGQITPEHVAAENAFYTQARAELGADASPSAVLQRAQALKIEHAAKSAPPPVTPVTPTMRQTLTQKMQARPLPTLRRVNPPVALGGGVSVSPQQQATALMLLVKQGKLSPAEADSKIQRLVGPGGRKTIRRPVGPE